jgi:hypothetical protein
MASRFSGAITEGVPHNVEGVRNGRALASVLGWLSASTCALVGIAYAGEPEFEAARALLATLAGLGALALAAVSLWQALTASGARTLLLILLSFLAAGFVAANVLALVAASSGVPEVPEPLHILGTISGVALYLEALVDVSTSLLEARKRSRDALDGATPV